MENKVKHFDENLIGRDFVVGDIHGCFSKLKVSLQEIGFDETKDRLFSVGDLVDRGPESEECLEWLCKPWFHAVKGNHEAMAVDFCNKYISEGDYSWNGGQWFIDLPSEHRQIFVEAFNKLHIAFTVVREGKRYGIVHGECPTTKWNDFEESLSGFNSVAFENAAMWSRDRYRYKLEDIVEDVDLVYVGHTPVRKPLKLGNVVYIDTGACMQGNVTVVELGFVPLAQ